ncbi:hypothetical protein TNCV_2837621 [Trichonephila clavipes]|nr:hypothetical protein TNCV_2837621 [Trichonephila clavipes]
MMDLAGAVICNASACERICTRTLTKKMKVSSSIMHSLFRAEGLYPYHYTTVQGLHPDDIDGRSPVPGDCNCNFYICPVVVYKERNFLGASLTPPKRVTCSHAWKKALHT